MENQNTELVGLYLATARMHRRCIENAVKGLDIHHSQHRMLMHLFRKEEQPSQKELAEELNISPAAVATMLKKLEADGYIARSVDEGDTRLNRIAITEKGRELLERTREVFSAVDTAMLADLSDSERETLISQLHQMQANLKNFLPADIREETAKGNNL